MSVEYLDGRWRGIDEREDEIRRLRAELEQARRWAATWKRAAQQNRTRLIEANEYYVDLAIEHLRMKKQGAAAARNCRSWLIQESAQADDEQYDGVQVAGPDD